MSITPILGLLVGIAVVSILGILSALARSREELREAQRQMQEERLRLSGSISMQSAIPKGLHPQSEAPLTGIAAAQGKEPGRPN